MQGWRVRIAIGVTALILSLPASAGAATFEVTNDQPNGPGSLADAIAQANSNSESNVVKINYLGPSARIQLQSPFAIGPNDIAIEGPGADQTTIDLADTGFSSTSANISISGVTLTGADSDTEGVVVHTDSGNVNLDDSLLEYNSVDTEQPQYAGGLIHTESGSVTLANTFFALNSLSQYVGGAPASPGVRGGMISTASGDLTMTGSGITDNTVKVRGRGSALPEIQIYGSMLAPGGALTLTRSSVDHNQVDVAATNGVDTGEPIYLPAGGTLDESVIAAQSSYGPSGGYENEASALLTKAPLAVRSSSIALNNTEAPALAAPLPDGSITLDNTIVDGGTYASQGEPACTGDVRSLGFSLASDDSCGLSAASDQSNTLSGLTDPYGGSRTVTSFRLNVQSPEVDAGHSTDATDIRGQPRTVQLPVVDLNGSDGTDIGADELQSSGYPDCDGRAPTMIPRLGMPFQGTDGDDVIDDYLGDETLYAGAGDDVICGSNNSTIDAGPGNDIVIGGSQTDTVYGGPGDDILRGKAGFDELHGQRGDDFLAGGALNDDLSGGRGRDTCRDTPGDTLRSCEIPVRGSTPRQAR